MKRALGPLIVVVGVLVALVVTVQKSRARTLEGERLASASKLRADCLERTGWVRVNPDEKAYKEEVGTYFKKYFQDVNDHVARFELNKEFDDYLTEVETKAAKKGKDGEKVLGDKKATFAQVKKMFDLMKGGTYSPLWTATDKGLRMDILSGDVVQEGGKGKIMLPFVLWGASRELKEEGKGQKKMFTSATFNTTWKLFDEKGKQMGEVNAEGASKLVDYPERYIEFFPPQLVLGNFPMELLPAEAVKLEINFTVRSRASTGGEAVASYQWKLDTPAEWKLRAGEKWEGAQDDFRPEEPTDPKKQAAAK